MKYSGLTIFAIGLVLIAYSRLDKHTTKKYTLDLNEKTQSDEFVTPVKSKLEIKLNGKKKQKVSFFLHKKTRLYTGPGSGYTWRYLASIVKELKGNSKREFDLESDYNYYFIIQLDPFIPFIVEYAIVEYNSLQDQFFNLGAALTATGLGIAFS